MEEITGVGAARRGSEEEWKVSVRLLWGYCEGDIVTVDLIIRYERDMSTMVRVVREFLKIPETTFSTQEIQDICGILNVNAHEVSYYSYQPADS